MVTITVDKLLLIEAFGFSLLFDLSNKTVTPFHIGFCSNYDEILWTEFHFNQNAYTMPWDIGEIYIGEKILDTNYGQLKDEAPPFKIMKDTYYHTKDNTNQYINYVEFYLVENKWTSKIGKLLHLTNLIYKRKVSLFAHNPNEPFGSSNKKYAYIRLNQESINAFDNYLKNPNDENLNSLRKLIEERIGFFMMLDKNF